VNNASRIALICVSALIYSAALASEASRVFSPREYSEEIGRLSSMADSIRDHPEAAEQAIAELRGNWKVQADGHDFLVDTGWLIDRFRKGATDTKARAELKSRLDQLTKEAEAFEPSPKDSKVSRATLDQILARGEFHQVHGPTSWDRLKYRILDWIFRVLSSFFGSSSAPTAGRVLVWTLVAVAVPTLAYLVLRAIRQSAGQESAIPNIAAVSNKGWRAWIAEAQAASAQGLWRDAVHLAYWAGISFLEEGGAWRPDKARTPREYLRLLSAESAQRPALSALTRKLEVTWYGNGPAGPQTFSDAITLLEDLGCRQA
jgi:hypothetical protein